MDEKDLQDNKKSLVGRIYALLCERECDGEWVRLLDNLLLDLTVIERYKNFARIKELVFNLTACRFLSYKYFRKKIFECINIVKEADI